MPRGDCSCEATGSCFECIVPFCGICEIDPHYATKECVECGQNLCDAAVSNHSLNSKFRPIFNILLANLRNNAIRAIPFENRGYTNIGATKATALGRALRLNTSLKELNLTRSMIGDDGATALGVALQHNTALMVLMLFGNNIGVEGATALGAALQKNSTLMVLDLGGNNIGDEGATALGEALQRNTSALTALDFRLNKIGDVGATALGMALQLNTTLTYVNLSMNNIGVEGARALGESLQINTTLLELYFSGNFITVEGATAVGKALEHNTTLRVLYLGGNDFGVGGAIALCVALQHNTTLTTLDLHDLHFYDDDRIEETNLIISKKIDENNVLFRSQNWLPHLHNSFPQQCHQIILATLLCNRSPNNHPALPDHVWFLIFSFWQPKKFFNSQKWPDIRGRMGSPWTR